MFHKSSLEKFVRTLLPPTPSYDYGDHDAWSITRRWLRKIEYCVFGQACNFLNGIPCALTWSVRPGLHSRLYPAHVLTLKIQRQFEYDKHKYVFTIKESSSIYLHNKCAGDEEALDAIVFVLCAQLYWQIQQQSHNNLLVIRDGVLSGRF